SLGTEAQDLTRKLGEAGQSLAQARTKTTQKEEETHRLWMAAQGEVARLEQETSEMEVAAAEDMQGISGSPSAVVVAGIADIKGAIAEALAQEAALATTTENLEKDKNVELKSELEHTEQHYASEEAGYNGEEAVARELELQIQ
ncbi:unnamed protein product, partial [Amoebophrya sp. A25]